MGKEKRGGAGELGNDNGEQHGGSSISFAVD